MIKVNKVLGYRLLVKRDEVKSEGGLFIPEDARSLKAKEGTVIQVGPDVINGIKPGDRIAWAKYSDAVEVDTVDGTLIVMNSEDVLLTLD